MFKRTRTYLRTLGLRAYCHLQIFAAQEPVRVRAGILSAVAVAGILFPAVADVSIPEPVIGGAVIALPLLVGESTRRKVSPLD
ncbi:hypothetical protein NPS70_16480 [Streptomyces sp. C10-9-1]|uniref:hypothetical protein n=1 Tax=Streptomyces sp. C10-9-1 TaxID=1859285 RepID=UPI0021110E41|nr:hypothetical protein [Streptomyces sp. C10-9-1]MCQ6554783.1 hypothetical protein [Streptomyces sp. C10-9-1]